MTWLWVGLHAAGAVAGHVWGLWLWYWGVFAVAEAAGLVWGFPFTASVRRFLAGRSGRWGFLRDWVVAGWAIWLLVTWVLYAPFPPLVVGLGGLVVFGAWVRVHLLGNRW